MFYNRNLRKLFSTISQASNSKASIYVTKSTNIVFNLSTEEFFYEHNDITKPTLLLYQNDRNVVIGKHQNPWKECNINLMEEEKINLASRENNYYDNI
jgi:lipoate-protein ligase A